MFTHTVSKFYIVLMGRISPQHKSIQTTENCIIFVTFFYHINLFLLVTPFLKLQSIDTSNLQSLSLWFSQTLKRNLRLIKHKIISTQTIEPVDEKCHEIFGVEQHEQNHRCNMWHFTIVCNPQNRTYKMSTHPQYLHP